MNKREVRKLINEKPTKEEVVETTMTLINESSTDYLDLLLDRQPKVGRAVQLFIGGGHTRAEIGSLLGVTAATVGKWLRDPGVEKYMKEFQLEESKLIKARMHASSAAAIDKIVRLLDSPIDGIALQAAKDLLDRAGHKPKQEVKKEVTVKTFEQQLFDIVGDDIFDTEYEEV